MIHNFSRKILTRFSSSSGHLEHSLTALSPLDGRYEKSVAPLKQYFSEYALFKYRIKVEVEWLKHLFTHRMVTDSKGANIDISPLDLTQLDSIYEKFNIESAKKVKEIESVTNHDVKAIEYYIKECIDQIPKLRVAKEYVHFCCTSEDINNLSYALMLTDAKNKVITKVQDEVVNKLAGLSEKWADTPMLSRTHGQTATPSTVGKEIANFTYRFNAQNAAMKKMKFTGKLNGAVGNFNAHIFAYPEFNWAKTSRDFMESLGLEYNPYTTQIEPHDRMCSFYNTMSLGNTIMIGFSRDIWQYISMGYFKQKLKKNEIGSSTMPHKVNPIDFENCEGNLGFANSTMNHYAQKLPISRLQRDLSDSTVLRTQGLALGHTVLGYKSLLKGLDKLELNEEQLNQDLNDHYEVVSEAVQTILRKYGWENPYEMLKELTRGKKFTKESLNELVKKLEEGGLAKGEIEKIKALEPKNYLGNAQEMARDIRKYL